MQISQWYVLSEKLRKNQSSSSITAVFVVSTTYSVFCVGDLPMWSVVSIISVWPVGLSRCIAAKAIAFLRQGELPQKVM